MTHCAVTDCEAPIKARGWCTKHYLRWHRYGHPEKLLTVHAVCIIEGCDKVPASTRKGICEMHRSRIRTHGDPHKVAERRRPVASYHALHYRIRRERGLANTHPCVDCGRRAQQWSYNHGDPAELMSVEGFPYSLDHDCYEPRCVPCHVAFDGRIERAAR